MGSYARERFEQGQITELEYHQLEMERLTMENTVLRKRTELFRPGALQEHYQKELNELHKARQEAQAQLQEARILLQESARLTSHSRIYCGIGFLLFCSSIGYALVQFLWETWVVLP